MDNLQYRLLFALSDGPWEIIPLEYGQYVLGRAPDCDILLQQVDVSRRHTRLEVGPQGCWVMDLGSANGTQLDGKPLPMRRKKPISTGQIITIAEFRLKVECVDSNGEIIEMPSSPIGHIAADPGVGDISTKIAMDGEVQAFVQKMKQDSPDSATRVSPPSTPEPLEQATAVTPAQSSPAPAEPIMLRFRKDGGQWEEKQLKPGQYIIGRSKEADIMLAESGISRRHAQIDITESGCFLKDLGSANGTKVESVTLQPNKAVQWFSGQSVTMDCFELAITGLPQKADPDIKTRVTPAAQTPDQSATRVTPQSGDVAAARAGPIIPQAARTRISAGPTPVGSQPSAQSGQLIRYRRGMDPWQETRLDDGEHYVGRGQDCTIRLDSRMISRHHAMLTIRGSDGWVTDLGSKNGVDFRGQKLTPQQGTKLTPGDTFKIDEFEIAIGSQQDVERAKAPMIMQAPDGNAATMIGGTPDMPGAPMGSAGIIQEVARGPLNLMGQERVSIGRAPDNEIVFNHHMVSRYHAVIERMGTRTRLLDLHSANGVYVNDKPIDNQTWLKQGDKIRIGPYQILFTGNELHASATESYAIDVIGMNKWVTKTLNLLQDISISVGENEFVALVGMSGAGKSTMMDAINGFRPATHGNVLVNGLDMYQNYAMFRDDVGNVPQKDIVHTELTAEQALDYAAQLRMPADTSKAERKAVVAETLEDLGMTFKKDVPISRLSGGQLKRVSIGVELLTKPRLFFLDEPTSGLDPGTEYEMMRLLRRLADQGRTIMIITHATKNVMFCDKAIILAKGGNLAFYGPPENALEYFDTFRTNRERLEKDMEFDDIYLILNDEARGKPEEWRERYLQSPDARYTQAQHVRKQQENVAGRRQQGRRISPLKQFFILSARNLKIFFQDKATLGLTLALAPVLGLMNFMWGSKLFDPVVGDSAKVMGMWFISSIVVVLVGAMGSVRELVKENDIYKRERAVGLKILPYIVSKIWIGIVLAVYQAAMILFFVIILVKPVVPGMEAYIFLMGTMFLGVVAGYMLGLVVSAAVPNQNSAQIVLIAALVPMFLFAGVLQPLNKIPLGELLSPAISTRWTFEAFVNATKMGEPLANDACWALPKEERQALSQDVKENVCLCMGPQLFKNCATIPGIFSKEFYNDEAIAMLAAPKPPQPQRPGALPSPTRNPTPTLFPTPTLYPTPTAHNTPTPAPFPRGGNFVAPPTPEGANPLEYNPTYEAQAYVAAANQAEWRMKSYEQTREAQLVEYQATREAQFGGYQEEVNWQFYQYRTQVATQIDEFVVTQEAGLIEYEAASFVHFEGFADEMESFGDDLTGWETPRREAIASAEAILALIYDDYGRAFRGNVIERWIYIAIISFVEFLLILILQKRKDAV
jgi:ABC transport system ATP-binding/permease protein